MAPIDDPRKSWVVVPCSAEYFEIMSWTEREGKFWIPNKNGNFFYQNWSILSRKLCQWVLLKLRKMQPRGKTGARVGRGLRAKSQKPARHLDPAYKDKNKKDKTMVVYDQISASSSASWEMEMYRSIANSKKATTLYVNARVYAHEVCTIREGRFIFSPWRLRTRSHKRLRSAPCTL
jgi:hypothetical protein